MVMKLMNLNPFKHLKNAACWSKLTINMHSSGATTSAQRVKDIFGDVQTAVAFYESFAKKLPVDPCDPSYYKWLLRTSQGPGVDSGDTGEARKIILGVECERLPKKVHDVVNPSSLLVHHRLMSKARSAFKVGQFIQGSPLYVHHPGWLHQYSTLAAKKRIRALYNKLTQGNIITTHIDAEPFEGDYRLVFAINLHTQVAELIRFYAPNESANYNSLVKTIKENHYANVKLLEDAIKAEIDK